MEWGIKQILDFCFGYKNRVMYNVYKKEFQGQKFDLVLSSSYMTFPMPVASKIAKELRIPLVVDLRDIIEQYPGFEFIKNKNAKFLNKFLTKIINYKRVSVRNKILKIADSITTVSPWHIEILKKYNSNVNLIYNGFDPEMFYPESIQTSKFIITYTGRLHSTEMQNPELLFEAIKTLSNQQKLSPDNCVIKWYVDASSQKIVMEEAAKFGVSNFMEYHEYVKASAIPAILNNSSIILVLTNKASDKGPKGIMTTKFFEALAVEKPILCVKSDESSLEQIIKESGSGLAARNANEVIDFLKQNFEKWKEEKVTSVQIKKEFISQYSRKEQTKQFVEVFENMGLQNQVIGQ